jgi:lipoprotein-anchoring transpeptidase ErfK/SrfK
VALRYRVARALVHPFARREVVAPMRPVEPKLTLAALRAKYPAYIIVDRSRFQLMLFRHLRLAHTYTIAVGKAGLETPAGLYDVQWKQVDPPWIVPNSAWAGALAGKTIPPGPQDPIKARWLAFNGGAGIHGTDEVWSLGHNASHGCIRMSIPDVIQLYDLAPVHSPVFVA